MQIISPINFKNNNSKTFEGRTKLTEQTRKIAYDYVNNPNNINRNKKIITIKDFIEIFNLTKTLVSSYLSNKLIKIIDKRHIDLSDPVNINFFKLIGNPLFIRENELAKKLKLSPLQISLNIRNGNLKSGIFFGIIDLNNKDNIAFIEKTLPFTNSKLMTKNMLSSQYNIENIEELVKNNEIIQDEYGFIDLENKTNKNYFEKQGIKINLPNFVKRGTLAKMLGVNNHTIDYYIKHQYLIFDAEQNYIDINLEKNANFIKNYSKGTKKLDTSISEINDSNDTRKIRIPKINSRNENRVLNGLTLEYCIKNGLIETDDLGNVNYNSSKTIEFITKCMSGEISFVDYFLTKNALAKILKIFPAKILADKRAGLLESITYESQKGNIVERFDINSPKNKKYIENIMEYRSKKQRLPQKREPRIKELPKNYIKFPDLVREKGVTPTNLLYFSKRDCLHILSGGFIDLDNPVNKHFIETYKKGTPFVPYKSEKETISADKPTEVTKKQVLKNIEINPNLITLNHLSKLTQLGRGTLIYHLNKGTLTRDDNRMIDLSDNKTKSFFIKLTNNPDLNYYKTSLMATEAEIAVLENSVKKVLSREVYENASKLFNHPEIELDKYINQVIETNFNTSEMSEGEINEFSSILKNIIIQEISVKNNFKTLPAINNKNKYELYPYKRLLKSLELKNRLENLLINFEQEDNMILYNKILRVLNNFNKNKCYLPTLEKFINDINEAKNMFKGQELTEYCNLIILPPRIKKYNNVYDQLTTKSQNILNNITNNQDISMLMEDSYPDKFVIDILNTQFSPFRTENIEHINSVLSVLDNEYKDTLYPLMFLYNLKNDKNAFLKSLIDNRKKDEINTQVKQVEAWIKFKPNRIHLSDFLEILKNKYTVLERIISEKNNIYEVLNVDNIKEYQDKINNLPGKSINYLYKLFGLQMNSTIDDLAEAIKRQDIKDFNIKQIKVITTSYDYKGPLILMAQDYKHNEGYKKPYYKFSIKFDKKSNIDLKSKIKILSDFYTNLNHQKILVNSHDTYPRLNAIDFMDEIAYRIFTAGTNEYYAILRLLGLSADNLKAKNLFDIDRIVNETLHSMTIKQKENLNNMLEIINSKDLKDISDERHFRLRFLDREILRKTIDISDKDEIKTIITDFKNTLSKSLNNGSANVFPQQLGKTSIAPVIEFSTGNTIYIMTLNNKGYAHSIYVKKNI